MINIFFEKDLFIENFDQVYQKIKSECDEQLLLKLRTEEQHKIYKIILLIVLGIFLYFISPIMLALLLSLVVILGVIYIFKHLKNTTIKQTYKSLYKKTVLSKLVEYYNKGLNYNPNNFIKEEDYSAGGYESYDYFHSVGYGLVSGIIGSCPIKFGNILVEKNSLASKTNILDYNYLYSQYKKIDLICNFCLKLNEIINNKF